MSVVAQIEAALKSAKLPKWIDRFTVEPMTDHSGGRAVRITLVVREDQTDVLQDGAALNDVARRVHSAVDEAGLDLWPYSEFVSASEAA